MDSTFVASHTTHLVVLFSMAIVACLLVGSVCLSIWEKHQERKNHEERQRNYFKEY